MSAGIFLIQVRGPGHRHYDHNSKDYKRLFPIASEYGASLEIHLEN
jgi:hypothetical protein